MNKKKRAALHGGQSGEERGEPDVSRLRLTLFFLSVVVGVLGGLSAIALRRAVDYMAELFSLLPQILGRHWLVALPAIGCFAAGLLTYRFAVESRGHGGVAETMKAVSVGSGDIRGRVPLITLIAASLTIGSGGSAGTEGPIIHMSAGLASTVARLFRLDTEHKRLLLVCGAAAGLSAVFNAPIGGALFALEVICQGFEFPAVIPVLLSSVVATAVSVIVMGDNPVLRLPPLTYNYHEVFLCFALGGLIGLVSVAWVKGFFIIEDALKRVELPVYLKPALGGVLVGAIIYFLPHAGGEGLWVMTDAASGRIAVEMLIVIGLLKMLTCGLTLGSGGTGGVFMPSMFIGAMFGGAFGVIVNAVAPSPVSDPALYAVTGMAAMIAATCRAPIAGVAMAAEVTKSYTLFPPIIASCAVGYFVSRLFMKESIYTAGLLREGVDVSLELRKDLLNYVKVGEVMTVRVEPLSPDMHLLEALEFMGRAGHTGYPVVDDGKLVGMVTLKDVLRAVKEGGGAGRVRDVMARKLVVAYPDETVKQALDRMMEFGVGRLPVVDRNDESKLLGILTRSDVLKTHELALLFRLGRGDEGSRSVLEIIKGRINEF